MLNYLKGQVVQIIKQVNNRYILILEVQQIAYEIQITSNLAQNLKPENPDLIQVYTHLQIKEENPSLYGFATLAERDLFRQLIGITGIGAQIALALIDSLGVEELVQAIVNENVPTLIKAPGIGTKTAERIILELKSKLAQLYKITPVTTTKNTALPSLEILPELEMTLLALGYESKEIKQAITRLSSDEKLVKNPHLEEWIKKAIAYLS